MRRCARCDMLVDSGVVLDGTCYSERPARERATSGASAYRGPQAPSTGGAVAACEDDAREHPDAAHPRRPHRRGHPHRRRGPDPARPLTGVRRPVKPVPWRSSEPRERMTGLGVPPGRMAGPRDDGRRRGVPPGKFEEVAVLAEQFDIVVLGGGPAGYATALYGAAAGLNIALVEERPGRRHVPAPGLHPGQGAAPDRRGAAHDPAGARLRHRRRRADARPRPRRRPASRRSSTG